MASTLLAVDDSVTMRKVLEITFAGPDFRVVSANSPDAALQKLKSDKPDLVIADVTLDPLNGYDLCKAIKKASPSTPVLILSSKQNAFDAQKASASQVDDHMDKPFDTQQMIDKVKKLLASQPAVKPAAGAKIEVPSSPTASSLQAPLTIPLASGPTGAAAAARPQPAPAVAAASATPQRAKTLIYNPPTAAAAAPPAALRAATAPTPAAHPIAQAKAAPIEVPREPHAIAAAHINGNMAGKLGELGLSPAQIDGVLALSREVVERVVWEVVPVLAETLIKEEISRLVK